MLSQSRSFRLTGLLVVCLLALWSTGCSKVSDPGSSSTKSVTIAQVDGFDDDVAVTALWKYLLEKKGYQVTLQNLDLAPAFAGIARGDVDAYMDAWLPSTHAVYVKKYGDKLKILPSYYNNDRLVLAVPKFASAQTISDVAKSPADYGNRVIGIEPGSGEMQLLKDSVMPAYQMGSTTLVDGSTPAMLASLKKAIAQHKPVVAALWTPHWAFAQMDIRVLTDDKNAWPAPDHSQIVLSKSFAKDNPTVTRWFSNTKLDDTQLSSLMADIHTAGDPEKGVTEWMKTNASVVSGWTTG